MAPTGGRDAREAERKRQAKLKADAEKALHKLEAAKTLEELDSAVKASLPFRSHLPALDKALPEAKARLKQMRTAADKRHNDDFMARVEEAERRDAASTSKSGNPIKLLEGYFKDLFADNDEDKNGTMDYEEFKQAMDIIAPSFQEKDLKAAFAAADQDGSGSIDHKEFMRRAGQYQLLSEKMGATAKFWPVEGDTADAKPGLDMAPESPEGKELNNLTAAERKRAQELFEKYDRDHSDGLDFDEFKRVCASAGAGAKRGGGVLRVQVWMLRSPLDPPDRATPS